ncbi:ABC transporter ATP-binding protein [Accumulibacter sp.]|jgi:zinc transport system ATP-binding protein|uniref:ABC transporter related n=1 Tax=Accumulibacter regalis TaxID=522306 RepID=C7RMF6_ACCRE|nr:ABC transporter ATP-binding protein [Accumulibacter sp.]MBN8498274.1 ABC transporter ATP-binding protein [Accumulibacter sp.]MBO3717179.1 ABC transporter ATP-binding protein [Accumulibacter sp.]
MDAATLEVCGLSCNVGTRAVVANASLRIVAGERVALVGGNGSGKTTLLRALLGLHPQTQGTLRLDGRDPGDWRAWRRRIAFVPQRQNGGRFPLRVDELIASAGRVSAADAAEAALQAGVETLLHRPLSGLSGGQLQRAWLARAFACVARGAGLLLADEPTAALDFAGRAEIGALLASVPVSALIVTHDRALAECCDRIIEIAGGELRGLPP